MVRGSGKAHAPCQDRVVARVGGVAEFVAEQSVEPVGSGFLGAILIDQITHAESSGRGADGERVHGLPPCLQIFDPGKDDLSPGQLAQVRLKHALRPGGHDGGGRRHRLPRVAVR